MVYLLLYGLAKKSMKLCPLVTQRHPHAYIYLMFLCYLSIWIYLDKFTHRRNDATVE